MTKEDITRGFAGRHELRQLCIGRKGAISLNVAKSRGVTRVYLVQVNTRRKKKAIDVPRGKW